MQGGGWPYSRALSRCCCPPAQVVQDLGTADIDARLEELLIDGILYAFQEQVRVIAAV